LLLVSRSFSVKWERGWVLFSWVARERVPMDVPMMMAAMVGQRAVVNSARMDFRTRLLDAMMVQGSWRCCLGTVELHRLTSGSRLASAFRLGG
jgi:hypothetical protein